jgi:DNA-directed RNA polymerase I, II, and III subunit RPABC1
MEVAQTFNAFRTVNEMLMDRGYTIQSNTQYHPNGNLSLTIHEFTVLFNTDNYNLYAKKDEQEIYVKFMNKAEKISVNHIRDVRKNVTKEYKDASIIYILRDAPNNNIYKEMSTAEFANDEIFTINQLVLNITRHSLVPKHILLTSEEKTDFLKTFRCKDAQVPKIYKTDPVAKYYGAKPGDVFKIMRYSMNSGVSIFYRLVK